MLVLLLRSAMDDVLRDRLLLDGTAVSLQLLEMEFDLELYVIDLLQVWKATVTRRPYAVDPDLYSV